MCSPFTYCILDCNAVFLTIACAGIIACFNAYHYGVFYPLHLYMCILYAALLQTAAGSEIVFLQGMLNLLPTNWPQLAAHLDCTASYIDEVYNRYIYDKEFMYLHVEFPERCFYSVTMDWGHRKEGTGNRPHNWKTVLEVYRKLCCGSDEKLSKLASFEKNLISGIKWY